ncbi:MAG TPA: asparagine synthase (glutamine-hydrolyzing) [Gemmataceae bacterium]|nr:asparagine synthase (glutamine-hydrolyzing) [Gemmataceae bacterium]
MCGIAGFVTGPARNAFAGFQADVLDRLAHRGPDDRGWLIDGVAGQGSPPAEPGRYGLFHRRLSILDLSPLGHQPMATPDGRFALVFNGEIYNYLELRADLEKDGARFRSQSDTEVLLHGLARFGPAFLPRLVGMFALALLDRDRRRLLLVRDFFGIKPLYYCRPGGGFAFASEPKALRPLLSGRVRADRLFDYLRDGLTDAGSGTLFDGLYQLPAAHWMEVDLETGTPGEPVRYWDIDLRRRADITFPEAVARARELFLESVRLHLRSDVPVGTALSGGIDSSAVVAAVRAVEPRADIRTFTFRTDEPGIAEGHYADLAAEAARAHAHPVGLGAGDLAADLDALIGVQDEPFGSTSIYAQYRVFRRAAESGVKVMLDGQGADEMLAGYDGYFAARVGSLLGRGHLADAYRFATRAATRPGVGGRAILLARGLRRMLPSGAQANAKRLIGRPPVPAWLNRGWFEARGAGPGADRQTAHRGHQLRERLYDTFTRTSLPMLLRYEDRNSMAWSIESRVPFLTPAQAEFYFSLPEEYLISPDGVTKHVFREAMRGLVPDAILDRKDKIGFATPEKRWLAELGPWVDGILSPDRLARVPALDAAGVRKEWQGVRRGARPFDWRVWRWVNLVRWAERCDADFTG